MALFLLFLYLFYIYNPPAIIHSSCVNLSAMARSRPYWIKFKTKLKSSVCEMKRFYQWFCVVFFVLFSFHIVLCVKMQKSKEVKMQSNKNSWWVCAWKVRSIFHKILSNLSAKKCKMWKNINKQFSCNFFIILF